MTQAKRYKRYSAEFKREAIVRASEEGMTDKAVCADAHDFNRFHRVAVRSEPTGHVGPWPAVALHRPFQKLADGITTRQMAWGELLK